jgi:hypothetical protein
MMQRRFEAVDEADAVGMLPILGRADDDAHGARGMDVGVVRAADLLQGDDLRADGVDEVRAVVDAAVHAGERQ